MSGQQTREQTFMYTEANSWIATRKQCNISNSTHFHGIENLKFRYFTIDVWLYFFNIDFWDSTIIH